MTQSINKKDAQADLLLNGESIEDVYKLIKTLSGKRGRDFKNITLDEFRDLYTTTTKRYSSFAIPKRSGGSRTISAPDPELKVVQTLLSTCLARLYEPPAAVHGFIEGKSVVSNAELHLRKPFVLNIDLLDFFHSIDSSRIMVVLQRQPFNFSERMAFHLTWLCCFKQRLPQGAPTSPVLSNIVCQRLDVLLQEFAVENNLTYTRYADDLSFSSSDEWKNEWPGQIGAIIAEEGFTVNAKKVRIQNSAQRQEVTGLTVNEKTNVSREYIRLIRSMLYNWEKLGYTSAQERFHKTFVKRPATYACEEPQLLYVLEGKLNYLKMVCGADDDIFLRYISQYFKLRKRDNM
ncbi:reverse transcriptase family protein [Telluribacter sp.]|jgi:RNA-directed DNA polymerase|uniref:reverse transcriptase family protein n=1 Tax=Telluribacter sp. TaxID=1978767 RepID=UPI002E1349D4|nr:reverse transcriptase family protein [Telluribacter sp.]